MAMAKRIRQVVGDFPSFDSPERMITGATIFLYRDDAPRPDEHFWPCNLNLSSHGPYALASFLTPGNRLFEVLTDRYILQGDKPLWFHIDAIGIELNPFAFMSFHKTGGGGRGTETQKSEIRNQKSARPRAKKGNGRRDETQDLTTSQPPDFGAADEAADLATLRSLFDALRAFPEGWERVSTPVPAKQKTEKHDVNSTR